LAREYVSVEDTVAGIRGRMDLGVTLKRQLLRSCRTWCRFDELQYDIPRNRIIKATLRLLLRVPGLDRDNRDAARSLYRKLDAVRDVPMNNALFRGLQSHRLVREYDFALKLAKLISDNVVLDQTGSVTRFVDFSQDEARMNQVFESFLFNFYALERPEWHARRATIHWYNAQGSDEALRYLPSMHTDVYLTVGEREVIIDAKYYKNPLQGQYGPSVSSANLYQMFSYIENASAVSSKTVEGILVYAAVEGPFAFQYRLKGRSVGVHGLDLAEDWRAIHRALIDLVQLHQSPRAEPATLKPYCPC
jgi:5-methylcytosine-specific restriction enzyme subunit McrC